MKAGGGKGLTRFLLVSLAVLALAFIGLTRYAYQLRSPGVEESLDRVNQFAREGKIVSATLLDEDAQVIGRRCRLAAGPVGSLPTQSVPGSPGAIPSSGSSPCAGKVVKFHASYPRSDVSTQQLIDRLSTSARVTVEKQTGKAVAKLVTTFLLPLLILANLFGLIFLATTNESSISDIVGFGRLTRGRQRKREVGEGVTFADVAGAEEAIAELQEVTDYLRDPKKFEAFGAVAPKGVLLFGSPGCGKTLMARAVAGESGVPFFSISGAEFVESLVGVGAARVRDLFRQVREAAPAIVFIDEIDGVGRRREGEGASGGEREQTLNQLLVEMDGFEVSTGIVVIAATNRPDILDPALLRPGRFDRHITVQPPDVHGREAILELHARGKPISADADPEHIARATPGFTGADLANVVNEAALLAVRQGEGAEIRPEHLSEAVQRVLHGPQRRGHLMTAEEHKRVAYHESGHALVAAALGQRSEVQRVSVVARGRGLGQSVVSDEAERVLLSTKQMAAQLSVAMGGIAAETISFGDSSTAAEHDVDRASEVAREMVGRYGMSTQVGRIRVLSKTGGYLGGDTVRVDSVSAQTMQEFDQEVKRLITAAENHATELLVAHRSHLEAMVEKLEAEETLEGAALEAMLSPVRPEMNLFSGMGEDSNGDAAETRPPRRSPSRTPSGRTP